MTKKKTRGKLAKAIRTATGLSLPVAAHIARRGRDAQWVKPGAGATARAAAEALIPGPCQHGPHSEWCACTYSLEVHGPRGEFPLCGFKWVVRCDPADDPDDWGPDAFSGRYASWVAAQDALDDLARYWAAEETADGGNFMAAVASAKARLYVEADTPPGRVYYTVPDA